MSVIAWFQQSGRDLRVPVSRPAGEVASRVLLFSSNQSRRLTPSVPVLDSGNEVRQFENDLISPSHSTQGSKQFVGFMPGPLREVSIPNLHCTELG